MTISEKIGQLDKIEGLLRGGAANLVAAAGADTCAAIAERVINKGETSDGGQFSPYSTKEVPAYWYYGRSRSGGGESKVRAAAKKKEGVSYREFREFNNLQGSPKNFSFTNEMWRGFGVKSATYQNGAFVLLIGGKTKTSDERITWMSGQEGRSIVEPSKTELNRLARVITNTIINGN